MNKEIPFSGYSTTPSDFDAPDGSLASAVNVIAEDGGLRPLSQPNITIEIPKDVTLLFLHKTANFTHYIFLEKRNTNYVLLWCDKKEVREGRLPTTLHEIINLSALAIYPPADISITGIGNTLMLLAKGISASAEVKKMQYLIWRDRKKDYQHLGSHVPELNLSFGLQLHLAHSEGYKIDVSNSSNKAMYVKSDYDAYRDKGAFPQFNFYEQYHSAITTSVLGKVNTAIVETSKECEFTQPFFVRYALKLYDGSYIHQSAPVLMMPCSSQNPTVLILSISDKSDGYADKVLCTTSTVKALLDYIAIDTEKAELLKWKDIITSVDIFISKPIYIYDQNGKVTKNTRDYGHGGFSIGKPRWSALHEDVDGEKKYPLQYQKILFRQLSRINIKGHPSRPGGLSFEIPRRTDEDIRKDIETCALFYLIKSIEIKDLATEKTINDGQLGGRKSVLDANKDKGILDASALVQRQRLDDDYDSHDILRPASIYSYNSKVNLSGITKEIYGGYSAASLMAYTDGFLDYDRVHTETSGCVNSTSREETSDTSSAKSESDSRSSASTDIASADAPNGSSTDEGTTREGMSMVYNEKAVWTPYFTIDCDGEELTIKGRSSTLGASNNNPLWLCVPNPKVKKVWFEKEVKKVDGNVEKLCPEYFAVKTHETLNATFACNGGLEHLKKDGDAVALHPDQNATISIPNKIYTSAVNNPFYFPRTSINTVGTGEILAMCTAAKPLSQGQFGAFPLYAFTTEGVWALEVNATGAYVAKQPITRDVCINAEGITQLDSSVLFPTDRGVMEISGSTTTCITDMIDAEKPFDCRDLPGYETLHDRLEHMDKEKDLNWGCVPTRPFLEYLRSARMVYDYLHQRIIVYAPQASYAYVYSLNSKQWGMMYCNITHHLNSYPEAFIVNREGHLADFSTPDTNQPVEFLYATRPMRIDSAETFKTVSRVFHRGLFGKGNVATVLYGSRDLHHWHLIGSSVDHRLQGLSGTPYNYFRVASIGQLYPEECIAGVSIDYTLKMNDKLR